MKTHLYTQFTQKELLLISNTVWKAITAAFSNKKTLLFTKIIKLKTSGPAEGTPSLVLVWGNLNLASDTKEHSKSLLIACLC